MQKIAFPLETDPRITQPPNLPKPGSFYNDQAEGLIWIPEEYDTAGEAMKLVVTDKNVSIILEDDKGEKTGALAIGWMGFINLEQEKRIAGSIEVPQANIPELQEMGEVSRVFIMKDEEVRVFTNVELLSVDVSENNMMPASIQFIASDDAVLQRPATEEGVAVVDV